MFKFWYSSRCTRNIKLAACLITCAIIYLTIRVQPVPSLLALISIGIGIATHFVYQWSSHSTAQKPHLFLLTQLPYILLIFAWFILILIWPTAQTTLLSLQIIAFSLLGFYLISIYSRRAPR